MEQDTREDAGAGRTQHAIHILTRDDELAATLILPGLGRVDAADRTLQALVIAPDRDAAFAIAAATNAKAPAGSTLLTPIAATPRGERSLRRGTSAMCATADDLLALMGKSLFKPQHLRTIAIVWGEDQLTESQRPTVETVLAEAPRDADRLLLVSQLSDAVEHFATSFLWRARRVQHPVDVAAAGAVLEYAPCVDEARAHTVRLLLERLDPATATLVTFSEQGLVSGAQVAASLGMPANDEALRVVRDRTEGPTDLAILLDLPSDLKQLAGAATEALRVVALVPPNRLVAFAEATGAGATPFALSSALRDAYTSRDQLRDEVLGTIRGRTLSGEVLALEPLLADRDPVLVSAALLRLLESERSKTRRAVAASGTPARISAAPAVGRSLEPSRQGDGAWTRLFLSVGERDGLRRGDLVGAITGETGINGQQIGKIELRESHALVEVAADVAEAVVAKMSGVTLRGRRVMAKVDGGGPRGGAGERAPRSRDGGGRGREGGTGRTAGGRFGGRERSGSGREFGGKREREGERSPRQPRAMRESDEWGSRGDRLRNARRKGPDHE